jgi:TolB protein
MDEPVPVLEPVVPRRSRRIGLAVAVLALAAVGVAGLWGLFSVVRDAQPQGGGPPLLVVVETEGGIATTDGVDETLHARDVPGYRYQFPAWSPDGTRVAAIGRSGGVATVDVFDADPAAGGGPTTIYESDERPAFYLYWAPDGRHVTFLTTEPNPDDIALRIAPADASAPAEIVRADAPFYWDFVDSSRLILHTGSAGSEAFLGEVDLEGDSLEDAAIRSGLFRAPAVGGDGSSRAYVVAASEDPADGGTIVIEARDGSVRHEVPVGGAAAFGYDPTSTTLAFIAPDEPTDPPAPIPSGPLRTVDAATGEVRKLLDGNVLAFFWSPDGRTIATLDLRPADDVPDPGQARNLGERLASSTIGALPPLATVTPGIGLHLSFIDSQTAAVRSERDLRVSELFAFQVLPYFDQYARSHRFWAPDSSSIVLPLTDENNLDHVVVIPADGSDPHEVATGWVGFWSP